MKITIKKLILLALFSAIALVIFIIEAQIPLSFAAPGLKLGLANIVILFVLFLGEKWKYRDIFLILITRILLAVFITGQAMTLIYSFTGGILALCSMIVIKLFLKNNSISIIAASTGGAIIHNIGQLCIAALIMRSTAIFTYLPVLIAGGVVSGLITGFTVQILFRIYPKFINYINQV